MPLNLVALKTEDGESIFPIFTSADLLKSYLPGAPSCLAMPVRLLFTYTSGARFVLNPGSTHVKVFEPDEIAHLLAPEKAVREASYQLNTGQAVDIGVPADYPHALVETLSAFFARQHSVERACLALMRTGAAEEEPVLVVGIQASGNFESLMEKTIPVVRDAATDGQMVDLFKVEPGRSDLHRYFAEEATPFYERKKRGLFSSLFGTGRA